MGLFEDYDTILSRNWKMDTCRIDEKSASRQFKSLVCILREAVATTEEQLKAFRQDERKCHTLVGQLMVFLVKVFDKTVNDFMTQQKGKKVISLHTPE